MRLLSLVTLVLGSSVVMAAPGHAQDAEAGERVFKSQCAACHSLDSGKNMVGPSLFGIVGRHSSQVAGFRYSPANQKADLVFDDATLNRYLTAPKEVIPGTTMPYAGLKKDTDRANLIAFLNTKK